MAFASRKKPRRNTSITSSDFEFMSRTSPDCASGAECESVGREESEGGETAEEGSSVFEVLQEGYLTMSVRVEKEGEDRSGIMAHTLRTLRSSGSFNRSWKKRWCVVCRTEDGISIFYYNKQSSYTNLDVPIGILFMEESRKIFTIPSHPKSRAVFAIDFPYRTVHLFPEKEHQLSDWLDVLKSSLGLTEYSSPPSPPSSSSSSPSPSPSSSRSRTSYLSLRAPMQKVLKRDFRSGCIEEEEGVVLARAVVRTTECEDSHVSRQPISGSTPSGDVNYLSYSTLAS